MPNDPFQRTRTTKCLGVFKFCGVARRLTAGVRLAKANGAGIVGRVLESEPQVLPVAGSGSLGLFFRFLSGVLWRGLAGFSPGLSLAGRPGFLRCRFGFSGGSPVGLPPVFPGFPVAPPVCLPAAGFGFPALGFRRFVFGFPGLAFGFPRPWPGSGPGPAGFPGGFGPEPGA